MPNTVAPTSDNHETTRAATIFSFGIEGGLAQAGRRAYLDTLIPAGLDAIDADETDLRNAALTRGLDLLDQFTAGDMLALAATLHHLGTVKAERDATTSRRRHLELVKASA